MTEFRNVCFSYGDNEVLKGFDLTVHDGQCVCLSGPSGCGKTTALMLASGLLTPTSGTLTGSCRPSVVFQEDRLLSGFSLKKNILLPIKRVDRHVTEQAMKLLCEVGLEGAEKKKVCELSGGMKRRAAVVRAVLFGGDMLILDEPFNGIDEQNKRKTAAVIKREFLEKGKAVLMVSHVPSDAELLGADVVEMPPKANADASGSVV